MANSYNGWANFATWKTNLELVDHDYWREYANEGGYTPAELADALRDATIEMVEAHHEWKGIDPFSSGVVSLFLSEVDWWEIADSILEG